MPLWLEVLRGTELLYLSPFSSLRHIELRAVIRIYYCARDGRQPERL